MFLFFIEENNESRGNQPKWFWLCDILFQILPSKNSKSLPVVKMSCLCYVYRRFFVLVFTVIYYETVRSVPKSSDVGLKKTKRRLG
jgi:hypothetical protein